MKSKKAKMANHTQSRVIMPLSKMAIVSVITHREANLLLLTSPISPTNQSNKMLMNHQMATKNPATTVLVVSLHHKRQLSVNQKKIIKFASHAN